MENKSQSKIIDSFLKLYNYCEKERYQGWDPYDGLNSKLFNISPIRHWAYARLAWIQLFKRSPLNLRILLKVPKGYNSKGLGLFLSAYSNLYLSSINLEGYGITKEHLHEKICYLAEILLGLRVDNYSGACWGYNFDWQARGGLFFPLNTPTIVATTFASYGLMDAYEITKKSSYLDAAISSAQFVVNDLKRSVREDGSFLFSYSPLLGNNSVYNASLLGSKLLARIYSYTLDDSLLKPARLSVQACLNAQESDGSWIYGELKIQNWKDSYHSGFNLESLSEYYKFTKDKDVLSGIEIGLEFYLNNFFSVEGVPKYYHDSTYPIDIHSPSQLIVTLSKLNCLKENSSLTDKVMDWTIDNMQHNKNGYFYYQLKRSWSSRIPYMRWSQAWMLYAMSFLIKNM